MMIPSPCIELTWLHVTRLGGRKDCSQTRKQAPVSDASGGLFSACAPYSEYEGDDQKESVRLPGVA